MLLATLSPAASSSEETLSTLRFADRAKRVTLRAVKNPADLSETLQQQRQVGGGWGGNALWGIGAEMRSWKTVGDVATAEGSKRDGGWGVGGRMDGWGGGEGGLSETLQLQRMDGRVLRDSARALACGRRPGRSHYGEGAGIGGGML